MTKCGNYRDPNYLKNYREKNKNKEKDYKRKYYEKNKSYFALCSRIRYLEKKENKEKVICHFNSYDEEYMKNYYLQLKKKQRECSPHFKIEKKTTVITFD